MEPSKLYSLLSNENRLKILGILSREPSRFTAIQRSIGISSPELARQLSNLLKVGLVEAHSGGYALSNFGRITLESSKLIDYIAESYGYLSKHDISPIPDSLKRRLDILSDGRVISSAYSILDILRSYEPLVQTRYWDLSDDYPSLLLGLVEGMLSRDVEIRVIYPPATLEKAKREAGSRISEGIKAKALPSVKVTVVVSDVFAMFGLPDLSGVVDRQNYLFSETPRFIDWCREFFECYWEKARAL